MSQTEKHLLPLVPSGESQRAKKGKCTVLLCVSKHNKSAAGLKGKNVFFFFIPLCLLFSLHISSSICFLRCRILLQRSLHRWGSIKLHLICLHASSRLLLLFFFFLAPSAAAADLRVGKLCWDFSGFHLTGGRHMEAPPPLRPQAGSGGTGLSFCVFPPFCSRPSLHPALLPSFCPCLLSREEGGGRRAGTSMYKHTRLRTKK